MNDRPNDEIEDRLRAALASRADSVEPTGDGAEVVDRMAAARAAASHRRTVLAAAAVAAVVALAAGAFVLLGDDDPDTEVATGGTPTTAATTTTTAESSPSGRPVIWPLPSMSVSYAEAADAVAAFGTGYLGLDPSVCVRDPDPTDGTLLLIPSPEGCSVEGEPHPASAYTEVAVERRAQGWVVLGAEASWLEVTPAAGAVVGADIEVTVVGPPVPDEEISITASLPPVGQHPSGSPSVDDSTTPRDADGTWRVVLGAADGPTVLLVHFGIGATARVITVDAASVPVTTTTTTTGPTDDGVEGWPGTTSRQFDGPEAAAHAYVDEVLGFADPALAGQAVDGADAEFRYHRRPTASIETTIFVHDTGPARGWVVTGTRSAQGAIDRVFQDGDTLVVQGAAAAADAQVYVALVDAQGTVIAETGALAGGSGVTEPFEARFAPGAPVAQASFLLIAEADASGEGYTWATIRLLAPLLASG